ncbi:enoyl-CoA hydratase/isomerase family protein [Pikeienuella piscinae]|uniref:Enoyl-CoA hydratase/isomerase family protein n=1 Tax=Pikeienuella piscinae TaxID=2748098 RepID=A0A7L5C388_9RHOB|nr:enoyl-CoA hydratase/isomerase family protein [Pikeienuella piscinae]QIE56714.1 enoyl-CoA hydratase/isomerase family protein [Pikeienuella piscinae]
MGDTERPLVLSVRDGNHVTLTLNRAEQLNPLDRRTIAALRSAVAEIEEQEDISVVVIRGAGRAFSAGGDLEGYLDLYRDRRKFMRFLRDFQALLETIERSEKTFIAVVQGHCVAGGLELVLACDIVLVAHEARIADGHLNFAQLPGAGGSQRLPRAIGALRAKLLILTGRMIDGVEAERIGLASLAAPLDSLDETLAELLKDLDAHSPLGLRSAKYLVNSGALPGRDLGLELELTHVHHYATTSRDASEGLIAFRDKRKPDLRGE